MGDTDASHAGIDLDTICLEELMAENRPDGGSIRSDPDNHSVFINGIFKKMKDRPAFLSFSRQISDVNEILTMKYSSADDIAEVILKDLALTSQVLRLVNSSLYRHFARKGIATISEAMIILGTDEVRGVAASLKIYEMLKDLANTQVLKDKTLKGLQRSIMTRHFCEDRGIKGSDALPISAMIYDLGEYLVALFDPGKYVEIEVLIETRGMSRAAASKSILGLSYSDLGRVMAVKLNLPDAIVQSLRPVAGFNLKGKELSQADEGRYLCAMVYELCEISMGKKSSTAAEGIVNKYSKILGIDLKQAVSLMELSQKKMLRHADLLNVEPVAAARAAKPDGISDRPALKEGLNRVKEALNENLSIHEICTRIVEVMDKSFCFDQVVLSIRKKQTNTMEPRFVRGKRSIPEISKVLAFKISSASPDLFNAAISRKSDMVVRHIEKESYKKQIPAWYLDGLARPYQIQGFATLPVFAKDKLVAMVYVDWDPKAPDISPTSIEYLKVFRELMVKTFTHHAS